MAGTSVPSALRLRDKHRHSIRDACSRSQGRVLLWAWMQEARKVAGTFDYAGCLSCPRELWLDPGDGNDGGAPPTLVQRPVPELDALRQEQRHWAWPPPAPPTPSTTSAAPHPHTDASAQPTKPHAPLHAALRQQLHLSDHLTASDATAADGPHRHAAPAPGSGPQRRPPAQPAAEAQPPGRSSGGDVTGAGLQELVIRPGEAVPIPQVSGSYLDVELELQLVVVDTIGTQPLGPAAAAAPRASSQPAAASAPNAASHPAPPLVAGAVSRPGTPTRGGQDGREAQQEREEGLSDAAAALAWGQQHRTSPQRAAREAEGGGGGGAGAGAAPPGLAGASSGVVLRAWQAGAEGAAAVLYSWESQMLEVSPRSHLQAPPVDSRAAPGSRAAKVWGGRGLVGAAAPRPFACFAALSLRGLCVPLDCRWCLRRWTQTRTSSAWRRPGAAAWAASCCGRPRPAGRCACACCLTSAC